MNPPVPSSVRTAWIGRAVAERGPLQSELMADREAARRIGEALDAHLLGMTDQFRAARFARACPVVGQRSAAYLHRVVRTPGGRCVLAGIRFKGGDVRHPFVDLLAWDRPLGQTDGWSDVLGALFQDFAAFSPRWVRVCLPGEAQPGLPKEQVEVDQWLVGAPVSELVAAPRPWGEGKLALEPATDLAWVNVFHAAFAHWQSKAGPRGQEVHAATEAELQACLDDGVIMLVRKKDRFRGLMAARRQTTGLFRGHLVIELFLHGSLRGQRLAPVLQRALIDQLVDQGRDLLVGTIHSSNTPSLKTALRCGRRILESWWFVRTPPGDTG